MENEWVLPVLGVLILVGLLVSCLLFFLRKTMGNFGGAIQFERARELFKLQREHLHKQFFQTAAGSGSPRGLLWKECEWESVVEFVRDRQSRQIVAFAGVTIHFEAVVGSDMEGLPAVGMPRNASAIFSFHRGQWHTTGKTIFNKNPDEAAEHFHQQYERLGAGE
jgi:hypothetical protein